jgi:hypothetical protein
MVALRVKQNEISEQIKGNGTGVNFYIYKISMGLSY